MPRMGICCLHGNQVFSSSFSSSTTPAEEAKGDQCFAGDPLKFAPLGHVNPGTSPWSWQAQLWAEQAGTGSLALTAALQTGQGTDPWDAAFQPHCHPFVCLLLTQSWALPVQPSQTWAWLRAREGEKGWDPTPVLPAKPQPQDTWGCMNELTGPEEGVQGGNKSADPRLVLELSQEAESPQNLCMWGPGGAGKP